MDDGRAYAPLPGPRRGAGGRGERRRHAQLHVYSIVGSVPIAAFNLDHANAVMRGLPDDLEASTRRRIGKTMARVLSLATFPLRLIPASPLPRAWMPRAGEAKAKGYVYPDEDRVFLASPDVPLPWRVLVGFLHREGLRWQEAARVTWSDLDLERGSITLDVNKTDDPRAWSLNPAVVRALRAWKAYRERTAGRDAVAPAAHVFVKDSGCLFTTENQAAATFRALLERAGVARAQLFERSDKRRPVRAHDTRSGFITIALACGRTEAWVQDRTGHKSSNQINGYRRQARTAAEIGLGDWTPLDVAIPELGPEAGDGGEAKVRGNVNRGARPIGRRARIAVVSCGSSPPARGAQEVP